MARIIRFHIPAGFMSLPHCYSGEKRGKLLFFPLRPPVSTPRKERAAVAVRKEGWVKSTLYSALHASMVSR
jgi:hypothetical protein